MERNVLLLCESSGGEKITGPSCLRKRRKVQKDGFRMGGGWIYLKGDKCFGAKHLQPITWAGGLSPLWLDGNL